MYSYSLAVFCYFTNTFLTNRKTPIFDRRCMGFRKLVCFLAQKGEVSEGRLFQKPTEEESNQTLAEGMSGSQRNDDRQHKRVFSGPATGFPTATLAGTAPTLDSSLKTSRSHGQSGILFEFMVCCQ